MPKIILPDTNGGFNISVINDNFQAIADELNDKVLYRDNPVGEENTLETDVDANEKRIYNLPEPLLESQAARLQDVQNALAGGAANLIGFTPYLDISSTNIQGAIQEVKDDVESADAAIVVTNETAVTNFNLLTSDIALKASLAQLAASSGSALIGFIQAGTGAVAHTEQDKLRERVSAFDFMTTTEIADVQAGTALLDVSVNLYKAYDYAKSKRGKVFHPQGVYRVTSGYTQSTNYNDLLLEGEGVSRESGWTGTSNKTSGATILLDSTNPASFFFKQSARAYLQVRDINFACVQYVADRSFFEWNSGGAVHTFNNVAFINVECPIVYREGCYFQNASFTNVLFNNSGTFHSKVGGAGETNSLRGTLLYLNNVNHEGSVPINTENVICNLQGIRSTQATNFLLEGFGPVGTWTVLKIGEIFDVDWAQYPTFQANGFHSEWSGAAPAYAVDQTRGSAVFTSANNFFSPTIKYKLSNKSKVQINSTSFSGTAFKMSDAFELDSLYCNVTLNNCSIRAEPEVNTRIQFIDCKYCSSDLDNGQLAYSNDAPELLYRFDGGYPDEVNSSIAVASGTTTTPSTDATYGRKVVITPGASLSATFTVNAAGLLIVGDQIIAVFRIKLPVFTGGLIQVQGRTDAVVATATNFDVTKSDTVVEYALAWKLQSAPTNISLRFTVSAIVGLSGTAELYGLEIYRGNSYRNTTRQRFPRNVSTYGTAIPTIGAWAVGDIIWNTATAAAGIPGWVCTTAGTPGTWKAMAVVAA